MVLEIIIKSSEGSAGRVSGLSKEGKNMEKFERKPTGLVLDVEELKKITREAKEKIDKENELKQQRDFTEEEKQVQEKAGEIIRGLPEQIMQAAIEGKDFLPVKGLFFRGRPEHRPGEECVRGEKPVCKSGYWEYLEEGTVEAIVRDWARGQGLDVIGAWRNNEPYEFWITWRDKEAQKT